MLKSVSTMVAAAILIMATSRGYGSGITVGLDVMKNDLDYGKVTDDRLDFAGGNRLEYQVNSLVVGWRAQTPLIAGFSVGVDLGIGRSIEPFKFDRTKLIESLSTGENPNQGDKDEITFGVVPVFVTLSWGMMAGPGRVELVAGIGAEAVYMQTDTTDQWWKSGAVYSADNSSGATKAPGVEHRYSSITAIIPAFRVCPGYSIKVTDGLVLGLDIPVNILGEADLNGAYGGTVQGGFVPQPIHQFGNLVGFGVRLSVAGSF